MTTSAWCYANLWESVAAALPLEPAIIQGERVVTFAAFDAAADALAAFLLVEGLGRQAKVAVYAANRPEYLVGCFAAFKAGLAPFNVNYRYGPEEVRFLLDNGDAEAVLFDAAFAPVIEPVRAALPGVKAWIGIERDGAPVPNWATDYDAVASRRPAMRPVVAPWGRHEDDLLLLVTGGTTGMPKAVMWRQGDLLAKGGYGANPLMGLPPLGAPEEAGARALATPIRPSSLIAPPLMHATGLIAAFGAIGFGGAVILLPHRRFEPEVVWDTVERRRVTRMTIVGQPFAQPLLEALVAHPGRWDLTSLVVIGSSGAMWNRENKLELVGRISQAQLIDSYSSSEAFGMGISTTTATGESATAAFVLGPDCAIFTEDGRRVEPGSGESGRLCVSGPIPLGYYKDPLKSAATFPVHEGRRWSMPGDWATIDADGTVQVLGRGSQCINTGGEKVFPEEVEEALKRHPAVRDAAVTGVPDPRYGERIAALVEPYPNVNTGEAELIAHVRGQLAPYKAPRHVLLVDSIARAPNGKLDYRAIKDRALAAFAVGTAIP
ncbi:MAG: Long-chain-fatty-acid--CoA ligase [uncultured Sphingomonadaceae bacterium]|uniref:Long-chain-fatty-acid--CoA ligase n=1 Tax=uncultured Sphingomonadaceae bacterium TaxID=169976 RepID=A0A6J4SDT0_9SPHN|nr:MAG: Long-chain-fatty-acid--CoA ligase [uncultured Sphingomonadaceae bacterium]